MARAVLDRAGAGIADVVVIIAVALLPETRGKQLAVYD